MRNQRAKPLTRNERRRAILDAVTPLLVERGAAVTTSEMAQAADVAEGTIFRAFPDKATLLHEAVRATMDPVPIQEALQAIPKTTPIESQLVAAAEALAARFERITALMGMLRSLPHGEKRDTTDSHRLAADSMAAIADALAEIMAQHRNQLRTTPERAAFALRGLIFANTHQLLAAEDRMSPEEIVAILVAGILTNDQEG